MIKLWITALLLLVMSSLACGAAGKTRVSAWLLVCCCGLASVGLLLTIWLL